jgi:uncharacterized membrane protein YcaP (DUF421 family)
MTLETLFGPTGDVSWQQECARAAVIFAYGLLLVRLAGRRVFGQWTPLDIIVAIVTGSTLSRALTGNANLFGTLAATTLLMCLHWMLAQACARWPSLSRVFEGQPVRIGTDGQVDERVLIRHGFSRSALDGALRNAGIESASGTCLIVLETSGKISVLKQL